jgi:hypothetical protein
MKNYFTLVFLLIRIVAFSQDDLLNELKQSEKPQTNYAFQTFKGTRIINGQSVETKGKKELEFIFSHRFGRLNAGGYNLWGLDNAYIRLGLEYGITDRLGVSIGRTSTDKTYDTYVRYKLFRQSSGAKVFPVTVTLIGTANYKTSPQANENPLITPSDRLSYVGQILIARKFSSKLSLQVNGLFVHRNMVYKSYENNDDYAVGFSGRYKISKSVALTSEYFLRLNPTINTPYYNSLGFGVDIETGGHVFQLVFTNSLGMIDRAIVSETDGRFGAGDIHFGFNISRVFQFSKNH